MIARAERTAPMKDLTVNLKDVPGELATLGKATGDAGINIDGMCATTSEGQGQIHLLVEDEEAARQALEGAGVKIDAEREVLIVNLDDKPGAMSEIAAKLAARGVNIAFAYTTFGGVKLVLGVSDIDAAQTVL
jgi:hypothetical protein